LDEESRFRRAKLVQQQGLKESEGGGFRFWESPSSAAGLARINLWDKDVHPESSGKLVSMGRKEKISSTRCMPTMSRFFMRQIDEPWEESWKLDTPNTKGEILAENGDCARMRI